MAWHRCPCTWDLTRPGYTYLAHHRPGYIIQRSAIAFRRIIGTYYQIDVPRWPAPLEISPWREMSMSREMKVAGERGGAVALKIRHGLSRMDS
ncbi:hypothetical protein NDU88_002074 [Pleurodeles waltl]|uniref:Uncharacterized protein n=1 Tax=Pleurodeles waltl TaxID=8319 RepID=A0AAV7P5Q9_PLEWA|nr:hypothetical protein NDU88_002074 [Pleurodeles waltl]